MKDTEADGGPDVFPKNVKYCPPVFIILISGLGKIVVQCQVILIMPEFFSELVLFLYDTVFYTSAPNIFDSNLS